MLENSLKKGTVAASERRRTILCSVYDRERMRKMFIKNYTVESHKIHCMRENACVYFDIDIDLI